jgi:proline dehydrogenase
MLRSLFISLSKAEWARQAITNWDFSWKMATRFVAGEHLEDAIQVVGELNSRGINATLDHLGEYTAQKPDAIRATSDILSGLDAISDAGARSSVSIKLSQIGLGLGADFCADNLRTILSHAREQNNFVRIDMEDSSTVAATLRLYHRMVSEFEFSNVGVVIQAYLFRSENDVYELLKTGTPIRLCKGAYQEPPEIAYPQKVDVDKNYDHVCKMLMDEAQKYTDMQVSENGRFPPLPALATHDPARIEFAKSYAQKIDLPKNAFEFQMLYGIRRDLQKQLVDEGYQVRVYVPYGSQWYPYFMRRLAERPANVWFFASNFFRN